MFWKLQNVSGLCSSCQFYGELQQVIKTRKKSWLYIEIRALPVRTPKSLNSSFHFCDKWVIHRNVFSYSLPSVPSLYCRTSRLHCIGRWETKAPTKVPLEALVEALTGDVMWSRALEQAYCCQQTISCSHTRNSKTFIESWWRWCGSALNLHSF